VWLWQPAGNAGHAPSQPATGWGHKRFPKEKREIGGKTICIMYAPGTEKGWRNVCYLNIPKESCCFPPFAQYLKNVWLVRLLDPFSATPLRDILMIFFFSCALSGGIPG
jgi:hypothetical protein